MPGQVTVQPGDLLGPKEAAELLAVDRTTVSRWNRQGYLPPPFQMLGGAPVWTRETLEDFKVRHRQTADAAGRRPLGTAR